MTREEIIAMNGGKEPILEAGPLRMTNRNLHSPEWKLGYAQSALERCLRIVYEEPGVPMLAKSRIENIVELALEAIK